MLCGLDIVGSCQWFRVGVVPGDFVLDTGVSFVPFAIDALLLAA